MYYFLEMLGFTSEAELMFGAIIISFLPTLIFIADDIWRRALNTTLSDFELKCSTLMWRWTSEDVFSSDGTFKLFIITLIWIGSNIILIIIFSLIPSFITLLSGNIIASLVTITLVMSFVLPGVIYLAKKNERLRVKFFKTLQD